MSNLSPLSSAVSFDDLLKANKQKFDQIFSAQMKEIGLGAASPRSLATADMASAGPAAEPLPDVYAWLNARFGGRWSSDVVEHQSERDMVTVLCRLTVDGSSKMQIR